MKTTKWSVLIALAFLLVFVAGVKAADQRWLMAQEESTITQQGSEEMAPATSAPDQGNEEIAPTSSANLSILGSTRTSDLRYGVFCPINSY